METVKGMIMLKKLITLLIVTSLFIPGCGNGKKTDEDITDPLPSTKLAGLKSVQSITAMSDTIKQRTSLAMEARIDGILEDIFNNSYYCYYDGNDVYAEAMSDSSGASSSASPEQYSTTNNQTTGVDEADFVKNDGNYIYIASASSFKIIDAWPPEQANIISSVEIEGEASKLYIYSKKAVVYSGIDPEGTSPDTATGYYNNTDCSYGYNCDFSGDSKELKITVFSIEDPLNPILEREIDFSGSFINARRIDNAVHTVVHFPEARIPGLSFWPESLDSCFARDEEPDRNKITVLFQELKAENNRIINAFDLNEFLPQITDTIYTADGTVIHEDVFNAGTLFESKLPDGNSVLSVVSLDLDKTVDIESSSILGRSGAVYASGEALYIASRERYNPYIPWFFSDEHSSRLSEVTTIHKFTIQNNPVSSAYDTSGAVKGRVLNQFSMDEHDNALRIATTSGYLPSPDAHNTMSVLMKVNDKLTVVGMVDRIAEKEDIRSVRFNGTKGYIVTFKKTDPLFVFDLSDPKEPLITGELKIPGFSTYMHLMDETHLLTIGYDADDHDSFAWFDGIMLQIFDVADMKNPKLVHKEIIGTRGSSSEGTLNHLAFNYFAPKDLLAIPITICEGGDNGYYGQDLTFSGLIVYDVTAVEGFSERARISHMDSDNQISCNNWWTNSNSTVKRSIIMDDYIFSIAKDKIKIAKLENPVLPIGSITLSE